MRDGIIGIVIGLVVGVVVGTSFLAPQLAEVVERSGTAQATAAKPSNESAAAAEPQPAPRRSPPLQWRMASAVASSLPLIGEQALRLESELRRVSDGDIDIRFHEPDALVPAGEVLNAVSSGVVEAGYAAPSRWQDREPAMALFAGFPFGPDAEEFLAWIYFGGGEKLMQSTFARHGVHALVCGATAAEGSGWFRNTIQAAEDFKDLRIGISGMAARVLRRLGANTQDVTPGAAFAALESDQLDAVEFSQPAIDLRVGFHKMIPHYYFPGWHQPILVFTLMINAEKWDALSNTQQTRIGSVCGDIVRRGLAQGSVAQFQALKELVDQGAKIHRWPRDMLESFRNAWEQEAGNIAAEDKSFAKVWADLSAFRRDYSIWHDLTAN